VVSLADKDHDGNFESSHYHTKIVSKGFMVVKDKDFDGLPDRRYFLKNGSREDFLYIDGIQHSATLEDDKWFIETEGGLQEVEWSDEGYRLKS